MLIPQYSESGMMVSDADFIEIELVLIASSMYKSQYESIRALNPTPETFPKVIDRDNFPIRMVLMSCARAVLHRQLDLRMVSWCADPSFQGPRELGSCMSATEQEKST
jgi:hypothetical protein